MKTVFPLKADPLKRVIVNSDASSMYIEVDLVEDEVEAMKRYLESVENDIKKMKDPKARV